MANGVLEFALGLQTAGFTSGLTQATRSMETFSGGVANFDKGLRASGEGLIGTREKTEILRHSLESMGGQFSVLGDLSRMMLDPMTIGFAAVFGAVELLNRSFEKSAERMREFYKAGSAVENIVKGIVNARPTSTDQWVERLKEMGKASEKSGAKSFDFFGDQSQEVQKEVDKNNADAAQEQLSIEQKKVELMREQGRISEADAAKRIEALKNQAVLQKNLAEQTALKDQISGRRSDLAEIQKQAGQNPVSTAFERKQQADAQVTDMQKQLEDLPKAIAGFKHLQVEAEEKSKGMYLNPNERGHWVDQSAQAGQRATALQAQLDAVKSGFADAVQKQTSANEGYHDSQSYQTRAEDLTKQISTLKNDLGVTQDRQRKLTPLEMQQNHLDALSATDNMSKGMLKTEFKDATKPVDAGTSLEKMGFVMGGTSNLASQQLEVLKQIHGALTRQQQGGGTVTAGGPRTGLTNEV